MSKFNKIKVGDSAEISHLITQEDIDKFVELTGDDNKIHIDEDFASKTSLKKPVVHGMLGRYPGKRALEIQVSTGRRVARSKLFSESLRTHLSRLSLQK